MIGWLIAASIFLLLALFPVGAHLIYSEKGIIVSLLFGWIQVKLLPKKHTPKVKKENKPKKKKVTPEKTTGGKKTAFQKGGKISDFIPFVTLAGEFLSSFWRKLRVRFLEIRYTMAGGDPCDLALNYGKAWAAVGNVMPYLDRIFVIKKRNIQVECDFTADSTTIFARLDITITLGRLIGLAVKYGWLALREFLRFKNSKKGGKII